MARSPKNAGYKSPRQIFATIRKPPPRIEEEQRKHYVALDAFVGQSDPDLDEFWAKTQMEPKP